MKVKLLAGVVPKDATSISYGVLLISAGEVWMNDLSLEAVDIRTPTTGTNRGKTHRTVL